MAHKKKHSPPVPAGNQPHYGPEQGADSNAPAAKTKGGEPFQHQDPKRRLGNFESAGEHAFVQPGGKNDANR